MEPKKLWVFGPEVDKDEHEIEIMKDEASSMINSILLQSKSSIDSKDVLDIIQSIKNGEYVSSKKYESESMEVANSIFVSLFEMLQSNSNSKSANEGIMQALKDTLKSLEK